MHSKLAALEKCPQICIEASLMLWFCFCSAKCSLWVSGLGSSVSASDLKTLFSPFGSVSYLVVKLYLNHVASLELVCLYDIL